MVTKTPHGFGMRLVLIFIFVIGTLGVQPPKRALAAATLTVINTNDSGAGSLRQAVLDAASGDTITFGGSLAGQTIALSSQLTLSKDLTIDGSGLSPQVILSGQNVSRIMEIIINAQVTISDLTFTDGNSIAGGAIHANGNSELTLKNSTLRQNHSSSSGGAILMEGNSAGTILNTTFYQNQADTSGGAVSIISNGNYTISSSIFSENNAAGNGGALSGFSNFTIKSIDNTFTKNIAGGSGGAISGIKLDINRTAIYQNQASQGGAIAIGGNSSGNTIVNSTIVKNQASSSGGGIFISGNTVLDIFSSTFAQNSAVSGHELTLIGVNTVMITNTIFVCTAGSDSCYLQSGATTLFAPHSILGIGSLLDYGLTELADNGGPTQTMALLPGSPLIDAGEDPSCANAPVNNLDQRGVTRPQGSHCDIGAYEDQFMVRYVKQDATGANDGSSWSNAHTDLQSALAAAAPDEEIWVAAGTYKPTTGVDRSASFTLKNDVALYGGFAGTEISRTQRNPATNLTVLSGDIGASGNNSDNSYHVVIGSNTNNSAILDGFTVTGGNANLTQLDTGGGMLNQIGSPTVANVIFSNNSAGLGGGMYNGGEFGIPETASYPVLTNVAFKNNSAFEGGGMFSENYVHAALTGVIFDGNTATRAGGGMEDRLGTLSLTDVVFKNNTAGLAAGGMQNFGIHATLTNVTFSDNSATMYGGGLVNADVAANLDPTLTNVTFDGNSAAFGGGMWNHHSSPSLTDVVLSENTATDSGGAIYNEEGSNLTLTSVTISNNSAGSGSGIYNSSSNPILLNVTFSGNTGSAGSRGGAMVNDLNSSPSLTNVTFVNNSVVFTGGAMLNSYNSNPSLVNVTFVDNSSSDRGGAIYNWESHPTLKHVTFRDNSSNEGGAIYNDENSQPSIVNSILYGDIGGEVFNHSGTAVVTYSIVQGGYPGTGNLDANPLLGPLQDNGGFTQTMALSGGSPAINAADQASCPATDQRGVTRPQGSRCDMGAYEYQKQDGNDTTGVFRPSNGLLYLKNSNTTGFADVQINYGIPGDYPVVGDWDGNGTVTIGIYRNGSFYLRNSNTVGFADLVFPFGQPGDQPVAGDWDGDGVDTIGVYRPSTGQFLLRNSNSAGAADMAFYLGNVGDVGIAGDWDGDGLDTTGVFRPSNGMIFLKNSNATGFADIALNYGIPGDRPVTGDWNDDGIDTIGVYRNGIFYLRNSNTIGFADIVFGLGNPGDMPIAGNWDGLP